MEAADVLRRPLLRLSESEVARRLIEGVPVSAAVVRRFVAGSRTEDAVHAVAELRRSGLLATVDVLGERTGDAAQAAGGRDAYVELLRHLSDAGLSQQGKGEVSVKLSALGQALPRDGERVALEHARQVCQAAARAGTTVTLDMEDHTTTDSTLGILRELRADFPWVGAVLQSQLRRTEADCRDLASSGSRVRLCKGAYREPASVAYTSRAEVDGSYMRCLRILMAGDGYPMVATHDPRLLDVASDLAGRHRRDPSTHEYQMLYGVRPDAQRRLAAAGSRLRVYVPYGTQWYPYLMRRLAERPANVAFFLRALAFRG
jgi:proline dehydrogenase